MGESGEWKDKDDLEDLKNHLREASKTMKAAMGFRVRVPVAEMRAHLLRRAEHHRLEISRLALVEGNHPGMRDARHRSAADAFEFCAAHLADDAYELSLEEATMLEFIDPDGRYR